MFKLGVRAGGRILLVAAAALTIGCPSENLVLNESDNGKKLTVDVGQEWAVSLRGNPTTGFGWEAAALEGVLFVQVGETDFRSDSPGRPGAGGIQTLTFRALKPGRAVLTLVYRRPWETNIAPLETFRIEVTITVR